MLYVDVSMGKDSVTVLNRKYSKEEIRDKLLVGYSEEFVEKLLARAVYRKEPLTIKCKEEEGVITTQVHNYTWYMRWGDTITITTDACFIRHERKRTDQILLVLKTFLYNAWWGFNKYILKNPWYI